MTAMEETQNNPQNQQENKGTGMKWRMSGMTPWLEKQAGRPLKTRDKVIGIILIVIFLFVFYVVLDANKYRAMVRVIPGEGKVGINPTTEYLDFGDLSPGMSQVRKVKINNGIFMPVYVMIWKTGKISDLVTISDNYFKVKPGEEKEVEFPLYVPNMDVADASGTVFTGRVYLFKIPTFGF